MIISEKLFQLRNRSGLSQEELAEKMNVSRQSISKWENGSSIPSIDKILELSRIYGVSTDFLLQDEQEEFPEEVVADGEGDPEGRNVSMDMATEYLQVMRDSTGRISLGVMLCILSPVMLLVLEGLSMGGKISLNEDQAGVIGVSILLCVIAAAVVLFVVNGVKLHAFRYLETDIFRLDYGVAGILEKEEKEYMAVYVKGLSVGIALCILAIIPLLIAGGFQGSDELVFYMTAVFLLVVSCGVYMILFVSLRKSAYDKLLQKEDYDREKKKRKKKLDHFSDAYWCLIVALYLGISFWQRNWNSSWIIWPVAGVFYAAMHSILSAGLDKK